MLSLLIAVAVAVLVVVVDDVVVVVVVIVCSFSLLSVVEPDAKQPGNINKNICFISLTLQLYMFLTPKL